MTSFNRNTSNISFNHDIGSTFLNYQVNEFPSRPALLSSFMTIIKSFSVHLKPYLLFLCNISLYRGRCLTNHEIKSLSKVGKP